MQHLLLALPADTHLSYVTQLDRLSLLVLPLGGAILAAFYYLTRVRRRLVHAVEANALRGADVAGGQSGYLWVGAI